MGAHSPSRQTPLRPTGHGVVTLDPEYGRLLEEASAPRRRRLPVDWYLLGALILALGLSLWVSHKELGSPKSSWTGYVGDAEQMMWFLTWAPHAVAHLHSPFVSHAALYPGGLNLMWNTSALLPAIVMGPITALVGPVASYNILVLLSPVATAGTAYFACRRYVGEPVAAVAGGLLFAFCPFFVGQAYGHLQFTVLALLPVLLLLGDELFIRQQWRPWVTGVALGITTAAQLLTGEEALSIIGLLGAAALVVVVILHPREVASRVRYALVGGVVALAVFVVLAAWPLAVQLRGPDRHVGVVHPPSLFFADLMNVIQPIYQALPLNVVSHPNFLGGGAGEWTVYIGFPLLLAIVAVVLRDFRRRQVVPVMTVLLVVFVVASLGTTLHINGHPSIAMPWRLVQHVPVLDQLLPGRLGLAIDLIVAVLFAVFVDDVVADVRRVDFRRPQWQGSRTGRPVVWGTLAVLVVASWFPVARSLTTIQQPTFFTSGVKKVIPNGSVVVVVPYTGVSVYDEDILVWQADSFMRYKMVDGVFIVPGPHSGTPTAVSETFGQLETRDVPLTPQLQAQMLTVMHRDKVSYIIVGPGPGRDREEAFITHLFGHGANATEGGVQVWRVPAAATPPSS